MKKKILVLGGSYFLGRAFTDMAAERYELHLINRGNIPLNKRGVKEYHMERHNTRALSEISYDEYAAVVDFCAYGPGDISCIFDNLNAAFRQYIFISTVDVYKRGLGEWLDENAPLEDRDFGGEAGAYIRGKAALESELKECCEKKNICYTSIRPAFIYGPGNYAPREGMYFNWIEKAGQIIHPLDADGFFQMVFVSDAAKAILKVCEEQKAYNEAFNICPMDLITYDSFADTLKKACGRDFEKAELSVEEINKRGIPLPFPLTEKESNRYSSAKAKQILGMDYISFEEGLASSFQSFINSGILSELNSE